MRIIIALAFFSQWSGNGLVSYYLNKVFDSIGITDPTIQLLINGILQIWNLAITVTASFAVERTGRRLLFLVSTIGMIAFFTVQTICSAEFAMHGSPAAAHAVIAMIFLYYASYEYVALSHSPSTRYRGANIPHSLAYSPLIVAYTIEILPFALRAKGFNIFNFVISVALIFNQYVNPIALGALGWKYYVRCFSHRALSTCANMCRRSCTAAGCASSSCTYGLSSSRRRASRSRRPPRCSTARRPRRVCSLRARTLRPPATARRATFARMRRLRRPSQSERLARLIVRTMTCMTSVPYDTSTLDALICCFSLYTMMYEDLKHDRAATLRSLEAFIAGRPNTCQ
jgi:hypothetical protein